jgi:hypothetical protein
MIARITIATSSNERAPILGRIRKVRYRVGVITPRIIVKVRPHDRRFRTPIPASTRRNIRIMRITAKITSKIVDMKMSSVLLFLLSLTVSAIRGLLSAQQNIIATLRIKLTMATAVTTRLLTTVWATG